MHLLQTSALSESVATDDAFSGFANGVRSRNFGPQLFAKDIFWKIIKRLRTALKPRHFPEFRSSRQSDFWTARPWLWQAREIGELRIGNQLSAREHFLNHLPADSQKANNITNLVRGSVQRNRTKIVLKESGNILFP